MYPGRRLVVDIAITAGNFSCQRFVEMQRTLPTIVPIITCKRSRCCKTHGDFPIWKMLQGFDYSQWILQTINIKIILVGNINTDTCTSNLGAGSRHERTDFTFLFRKYFYVFSTTYSGPNRRRTRTHIDSSHAADGSRACLLGCHSDVIQHLWVRSSKQSKMWLLWRNSSRNSITFDRIK